MGMLDKLQDVAAHKVEEFKRVEIPLYKALSSATSDYDTYQVPAQYKLAIEKIKPHVALIDVANELLAVGNLNDLQSIFDRVAIKAMNARVTLKNNDTGIYILGENHPLNLGSISHAAGGRELEYSTSEAPHIVSGGQTLRMDVTLIQSTASVLGGSTEYGVVVSGLLVRMHGDR